MQLTDKVLKITAINRIVKCPVSRKQGMWIKEEYRKDLADTLLQFEGENILVNGQV